MDYLALSDSSTFYVSRFDGSVAAATEGLGLYRGDTRHISRLELFLWGQPPQLLSYTDTEPYEASILLTNPSSTTDDGIDAPAGSVSINRHIVVAGAVFEQLDITSYHRLPLSLTLELRVEADFADIFEVRGLRHERRGLIEARCTPGALTFSYTGAQGFQRTTTVACDARPGAAAEARAASDGAGAAGRVRWTFRLEPGETCSLSLTYSPEGGAGTLHRASGLGDALAAARSSYSELRVGSAGIHTESQSLNELLRRSEIDLSALTAEYPGGPVPVAGIPWYAVPFGRDSILTSLETLWYRPELAKGTLRFLAAHQGTRDDPYRDEEPGKIMHELRFGELAHTRAIPHTPYFGTVDATPLFVLLFVETVAWTGDEQLYTELLPAVARAVEWIDNYGDIDGDGYVEYRSRSPRGIRNQGWKDSDDSLLYEDGSLADPPAALVEAQAYVYAAKRRLAEMLDARGEWGYAASLYGEASMLQERFNRDFWLQDEGYYAQALDHRKRPIRAVTSNPGHALMCGILPLERAQAVAERLLQPDMSSGWGIRTRSATDRSYNPMSYHNGSVWPHDSAVIACGMYRSGLYEAGEAVTAQLTAASEHFRLRRLPELMCGFSASEAPGRTPVPYDVSCSPQAWASGAPFMLLQAMLGLEIDFRSGQLRLAPRLPEWTGRVSIDPLTVRGRHVRIEAAGAHGSAYDAGAAADEPRSEDAEQVGRC